jgi:thymidylate kinase
MFIMLDGIDGSGKSTIMQSWIDFFAEKNKKIFSLKDHWKKYKTHPEADDLFEYDIIVSAEPTYVWIGEAIRQEIMKKEKAYSGYSAAQAYALDRLILYKRLIIPLLKKNKIILQDRGVSTSICYQSIQDKTTNMEVVLSQEGNKLALEYRPDHLVIADIDPQAAMERISKRTEKKDDAVFEKTEFLTNARNCFLSNEFKNIFAEKGTAMHVLSTEQKIGIMRAEAKTLLSSLIN